MLKGIGRLIDAVLIRVWGMLVHAVGFCAMMTRDRDFTRLAWTSMSATIRKIDDDENPSPEFCTLLAETAAG